MARELNRSYPYGRGDPHDADPCLPQVETDPLAELARLIGQADPQSTFGRANPPLAERQSELAAQPADDPYSRDEMLSADAYEAQDDEAPPPPPAWLRNSAREWRDDSLVPQADAYGDQHQAVQAYDDPHDAAQSASYDVAETVPETPYRHEPQYDARYDDVLYSRAPDPVPADDSGPPYAYPGHEGGYDEQDYPSEPEEQPRERKRGGILTVAVVLALAVVGTAGAFAYRSYNGVQRSGEPPVIKADAGPSKIVPPTQSKDPTGKIITDRIGGQAERVVSREEQPVDIKDNSRPGGPRIVFPPLTQNTQGAPSAKATSNQPVAQSNAAMSGGVSDEPKKIRTVSIRPDQAAPGSTPSPSPPSAAAPRTAPAAANNAPVQLAPSPRPQPDAAAPGRTASINPITTNPATPRAVQEGGYVVQVSSQRSEADAQASYRALQSKFPTVLASRSPLIRRADLGAKGIYYRAMIGPFTSSDEATQMCGNLKNVGGQCVVQRN